MDKWQLTENLTVWELWYFKAVNQLSWRAFSSSYSPYNLLARLASIKWILLATPNFHSPLTSLQAVVSHTEYIIVCSINCQAKIYKM